NGLDDLHGILTVSGSNNSVIGNHFSQIIDSASIRPEGATPVIVRLREGAGNFVSNNHVVAMNVHSSTSDDCFEAQVDALLATDDVEDLAVTAVQVDPASARNTILDSGSDAQVVADRGTNAVRATPTL
ncbi:right-handed parallel beta-helix repeat-containing protein, partial [Paenarthrobacter sp. RAF9]